MTPPSPELRRLVELSARFPRGLAFVHRAPVEAVAAALQVHPETVEEARQALDRTAERAELIDAYVRARGVAPQPGDAPALPAPRSPEQLARDAAGGELGTQFLLHAPLEVAAVMFQVHPDVVAGARRLLLGGADVASPGPRWSAALAAAGPAAAPRTRQG